MTTYNDRRTTPRRLWLLAAMAATLLATPLAAQGQATLEADSIALGDQTTLSGHFTQVGGEGIEVLRLDTDSLTGLRRALITSFVPGTHPVGTDGGDTLLLTVNDVLIDSADADLRDIAPLQRVPYTFWEVFRWILLAIGVAAAVVGIVWLIQRRKRKVQPEADNGMPADTRPADVRALEGLEQLRQQRLWQSGKAKEYHTALTDIVRRFIEECTDICATDMTSDETVEALQQSRWRVDCTPLRDIFHTADMVKFAQGEPMAHEHERSMAEATRFVPALWQAVQPTAAEAAPKEEETQHE